MPIVNLQKSKPSTHLSENPDASKKPAEHSGKKFIVLQDFQETDINTEAGEVSDVMASCIINTENRDLII